jgi:hypothetical protein
VASGRRRGGLRRWRDWLHRATHHTADDDRQLVQAAEQSRLQDPNEPGPGGSRAQASLDQVLRRAAAERAARHKEG